MNHTIIDLKNMKIPKCYKCILLAIFCLLVGVLTERNIFFPRFNESYVKRFQKVYSRKEEDLTQILNQIRDSLIISRDVHPYEPSLLEKYNLLSKEGLAFFIYQNDTIRFWSDNSVPIATQYSESDLDSTSFIYLKNAWYVPKVRKIGRTVIVGLVLIKQVYQYDNKLLKNEFQEDFNYPSSVKISSKPVPKSFPIVDYENKYLFSLVFDVNTNHPLFELYLPALLYTLSIIFALLFVYNFIIGIKKKPIRHVLIFLFIILAIGIRYVMVHNGVPSVFYKLDLFNPFNFAASEMLPSMGELLIWAILIFFFSVLIYYGFDRSATIERLYSNKFRKYLVLFIYLFAVVGLYFWIFFLLRSIILNSTISFQINKLLTFDLYSLISYFILILLFTSFTYLLDKVILQFCGFLKKKEFFIVFIAVLVVWTATMAIANSPLHPVALIVLLLLGIVIGLVRFSEESSFKYSTYVIISILFAFNTVFFVGNYSRIRNENIRKVYLVNLATENDRICEFLINDRIQKRLKSDSMIYEFLYNDNLDINQLYNHLKSKYFNSYFDKFNFQITVCRPSDSVYLEPPEGMWQHCYSFFKKRIDEKGNRVFNTDFYFIDDRDGQINYLGWLEYKEPNKSPVSLFIELSSRLITEQLGYPALLLDEKLSYQLIPKNFSYAKYYRGQLISQFGKHTYNLATGVFDKAKTDFSIVKINSVDHMVYRPNRETLIVLSSASVDIMDSIISFAYTFLMFFLLLNIGLFYAKTELIQQLFYPNFKNKIQLGMISFLFPSLILIGGVTLYLNIRQHYNKNIEIISEKLQSIYMELDSKLGHEDKIDPGWYSYPYGSLNELLIRFSNVFYIDINLYNKDGSLIATSRPEIFEKGLIGDRINPDAYKSIVNDMMAEVVKTEHIGTLKYFSAYVPFKNDDNKLLAFLNVPYFTRQEEFAAEVSRMVVTVSNVFVLLFLVTSIIAIFISRKLTLPLTDIQLRFSKIKLGQKYEKIKYKSNDEIGGLVNEYNRMVTELERSVELLAKSERESAWREMAKQIAHEINNPLTPMKLSVQHLQRAWTDKKENFNEFLDRICKTLIDEIDNLSTIAIEFSNFAKMPNTQNQELDLIEKISSVVSLFSSDDVNFEVDWNHCKDVWVYADKEQISRVLINLFKNAMQSVEKGVKPLIKVNLQCIDNYAILLIKDNGKGIPAEMHGKLFRPNFTTKTSGTGLGLAIVKSIIEGAGGTVSFETIENKGTTFIVKLPLYR
jgi:signal transduction histidine kinase